MSTCVSQILEEIEEDDRMLTIWVLLRIYPELTIRDVFEIMNDFLLLETLLIEMKSIPYGSIDKKAIFKKEMTNGRWKYIY